MARHRRTVLGRRQFLRRGAALGLAAGGGAVAGGSLLNSALAGSPGAVTPAAGPLSVAADYRTIPSVRLMGTDGWASFPGRRHAVEPVLMFGFRSVDDLDLAPDGELDASIGDLILAYKGKVHHTAPIITAVEGIEMAIVLTNLGFFSRPDLDDSHTLHWHGYRNATSIFDGVPEPSIAVPVGRDMPYFYHLKDPSQPGQSKGSAGTYMYHCHFEDVEHVQMGMTGLVYVEPHDAWQWDPVTGLPVARIAKVAYNGTVIDSSYDREYALLFNEIDTRPHDLLRDIQNFVWSDYDPNYWTINGRSYPDTVVPQIVPPGQVTDAAGNTYYAETLTMVDADADPTATPDQAAEWEMRWQNNSALIQGVEGERVLLRIASLGYDIHSLEIPGIDMHVIAHDASLLVGASGTNDLTYMAHRLDLGPGEGRDVIVTLPPFDPARAEPDPFNARTGKNRRINRYLLKARNNDRLSNAGTTWGDGPSYAAAAANFGGMVTEIWVYEAAPPAGVDGLPPQTTINENFPTLVLPANHI